MYQSPLATQLQKSIYVFFLALAFAICAATSVAAEVVINEFMASNDNTLVDENGDADDWVELYNTGPTAVDIGGWFMSDDLTEPNQSQIPAGDSATIIPAGGFVIMWFDREPEQGPLHIDAKLSSGGEDIVLFDGNEIIDSHTYGEQTTDISEGRLPDGNGDFIIQGAATPGALNDPTPPASDVEAVEFSLSGGVYENQVSIELTSATGDANIFYTTDSSDPDTSDIPYTGSINITATTVIRARAFAAGINASAITTQTYLIGVDHDFMIISTSAEPDLFFHPDFGMFSLYDEDIEIDANLEIFETDGTQVINQMVETEIQGTASAGPDFLQKSLAYKAKSSLGDGDLSYPFFDSKSLEEYQSLVGRNSGQDWNMTMFRDSMVSGFVRDLDDVDGLIKKPDLDLQAYRPAVTYLNGNFYGISNLRERIDRRYIAANYGLDRNSIDFLENDAEIREGDLTAWTALLNFVRNNDLAQADNYAELTSKIDLDNFIDYNVFNVIIDNQDWPGNNTRRWRERSADGVWRWMVYDLDFTFGLNVPGSEWNSGNPESNSLNRLMTDNGFAHPAQGWATELFRAAMTNPDFETAYINRLADQMNVLFTEPRMLTRLDEFYTTYTTGSNERQKQADLYTEGWNGKIDETVASITTFIQGNGAEYPSGRIDNVRQHVVDQFDAIDGTSLLTITSNPAGAGTVSINSITLDPANQPWSGIYFNNVTIPMSARSNRGHFFSGWSQASMTQEADSSFRPESNNSNIVTANFTQGSTSTATIVLNEINYNSADASDSGDWVELFNPGSTPVDISGWYFEDESGEFFGMPQNTVIAAGGYLLLVEDSDQFLSIFPNALNHIGNFGEDPGGFGLSGKGERVTLKNAAGQLIDAVDFDDKDPWPESPDGDGDSLQLLEALLDNNLASSWTGSSPTPGISNAPNTGPAQTIAFAAINDRTVLDSDFALSATASSGLPVSFSVSGPASLNGNIVSLNGNTGTVTITANQAGNADFDPAPSISQSFTVTLADNTIIFPAIADQQLPATSISLAATASSGLNVSYSVVSGPATINGNVVSLSGDTGIVTIAATQAGNNQYVAADTVEQSFTVSAQSNVITFPAIGDQFANAGPITLNATASSGLPISYIVISGPASVFNNTLSLSGDSGTVIIRAIQSGNANTAAATPVEQSFSVAPVVVGPLTYCDARANQPWNRWINTVQLNDLNHQSDKDQYRDYTTQVANLEKGVNYPMTIISSVSWVDEAMNYKVWIDFNHNGTFENEEAVLSVANPSVGLGLLEDVANELITIPANALNGPTRMRVSLAADEQPTPCGTHNKGEVNDFTVNITGQATPVASISCPADILVNVVAPVNSHVVNWPQASASTTCPDGAVNVRQSNGLISGSTFGLGTRTISYAVNDNCSNSASCSFDVTVNQVTSSLSFDQTISNLNLATTPGGATATAIWPAPTASSNCPSGGVSVSQTTGLPSGSAFPVGNTSIEYTATDNCGNSVTSGFEVMVSQTPTGPISYCEARANQPWNAWISAVVINDLTHTSGKEQYGDFLNQTVTLSTNETAIITLTSSLSWISETLHYKIWIDYNQNGIFEEGVETALSVINPQTTLGSPSDIVTSSFTVPNSALSGTTRMRISMAWNEEPTPCGVHERGEVNDFTVNINNSSG